MPDAQEKKLCDGDMRPFRLFKALALTISQFYSSGSAYQLSRTAVTSLCSQILKGHWDTE